MVINTMAQFLYYYAGMAFVWLTSMTGASASTLEKTFFPLPYVRELEHRVGERGGKRVWLFPEITQAWRRYLEEREA